MLNKKQHPIQIIDKLLEKYPEIDTFNFSKYIYTPQSLYEEREIIPLNKENVTYDNIVSMISGLDKKQEFAINSIVKLKTGVLLHIPMIDFITQDIDNDLDLLERTIPFYIFKNMCFYHSGSSFHAYSDQLLTFSEWISFMGNLLLVNLPNKNNIVDTRWVGHRLLSGYSALRWSCNTKNYKVYPKLYFCVNGVKDSNHFSASKNH